MISENGKSIALLSGSRVMEQPPHFV